METIFTHPLAISLLLTVIIVLVFPLLVGYVVLVERKVLADMQVRLGPMRVGPHGLLQPIADALKLLLKEDVIPADSDRSIFWMAPVLATFTALGSFAVIPFGESIRVADVNVGLLVITALSSVSILGIILGGWSSNSHYSLLGGLRSAAQLVSYEVALALALICGVMAAGTLSMVEIVTLQRDRGIWFIFDNFGLMIVPFVVYFISAVAETNRSPFDLPEAESELVAGFHTEYSGFRWALFMLSEYAAIFVVASVAITLFWGGWLRPFPSIGWLDWPLNNLLPALLFFGAGAVCFPLARRLKYRPHVIGLTGVGLLLLLVGAIMLIPAVGAAVSSVFWFFFKIGLVIYAMIWFRGTFPRFRYDQLMNIGWKIMIPIALGSILVNALAGLARG